MTLDQVFEQLKTLVEDEGRKSSHKLADDLQQAVRLLRKAGSESEISGLLINAPQEGRSVCITFEGANAHVAQSIAFAIEDAPALVSVIESRDTVVTASTPKELSEPLFRMLDSEGRVHLIPIVVHGAVQMVLVAADLVETAPLESLCECAGLRLEALALRTAVRTKPEEPEPNSKWKDLPEAEQSLHLRAQRFAQVTVARMRVEQSGAVREGQQRADLYSVLRDQIDHARSEYKGQFLSGQSKTMVDYLYLELVRSLANNEDRLLGPGFPGRLI